MNIIQCTYLVVMGLSFELCGITCLQRRRRVFEDLGFEPRPSVTNSDGPTQPLGNCTQLARFGSNEKEYEE